MEEAIRKLEKMIENPSRADKIVYTRGDIEDAIEGINRLKDRIKQLEEENKKLKEDNRFLTKISKEYMEKENIVEVAEFTELYKDDLEKENKKLNERIRFLEQCLDNKEKVNKSLREDLEIWKLTAKDYAKQCGVDLDDNLKI